MLKHRAEESKDCVLPEGMTSKRAKKPKDAEPIPAGNAPTEP